MHPIILRADALAAGSGAVLSHQSAARLHGIEIVNFSTDVVGPEHVTAPPPHRRHACTALTIHSREVASGDQMTVGGNRVTTPARTVCVTSSSTPTGSLRPGPRRSHSEKYSDRVRADALDGLRRRLLRFTWSDLMSRPGYIVDTIRGALHLAA